MDYCEYYQAQIDKSKTWFFTAILRSFEHVVFDRTLDKKKQLFEFFVPKDTEKTFLNLMHYFEKEGVVTHLQKMENRLKGDAKLEW